MQHKSLFAALLCGALCLTACLKNEESPSVTLVRNAKAVELESVAAKNNAEAYATKTLADAQAALLAAQAKLTEANIKLVEAQAEKEKAEAALFLAQAAVQQAEAEAIMAETEQIRVETQRKLEELKAQVAEYEARIAAAEAEKLYWEYVKQMLDKELEIALVEAEAALYDAKTDLEESKLAYAEELRKVEETMEDWAEEDLQALREKVEEKMGAYYTAAAELLDIEHDLIHEEMLIAEAEQGIIDATELKGEMIEYNNREIARLTKVVEYLEGLVTDDPEDLKDQLTDLFIAIDGQKTITDEAEDAYYAVYDEMWKNTPNHTGESPMDVTYTFTQAFFTTKVPVDGIDNMIAYLPDIDYGYWGLIDEDGDDYYDYYVEANIQNEPDLDDFNYYHQYLREIVYDYYYDDPVLTIDEIPMWTAYFGTDGLGMSNHPARYPELGEGIYYDVREPYTVVDHYEFVPLEINREGYEAYVDIKDAITELDRQDEKDYYNEMIDYYKDAYARYLARYEEFVEAEKVNTEKMGKKIDEVVGNFMDEWDTVVGLYEDYQNALNDYIKKYQIDNNVERTAAYKAWIDAYWDWYDLATDSEIVTLANAVTAAKADLDAAKAALAAAEKEKKDFEDNVDADENGIGDYTEWQLAVAAAKMDLGDAEKDYNLADKDFSDLETKYNQSKKAYEDKVEVFDAAVENSYKLMQDYADAYAAWQAAGGESSGTLYDAYIEAMTNYLSALSGLITVKADLDALEATMLADKANLEAAKADLQTKKEAFENAQKDLQDLLDYYPKSFDDAIADAEAAVSGKQTAYDEAVAAKEAFEKKIADAKKALDDAFAAWKKVAGNDDEWDAIAKKEADYNKAVSELGDPIGDLFFYYGWMSDIDHHNTDPDPYSIWYDFSESYNFDYLWFYYVAYDVTDPDFDMENYLHECMYYALCAYFADYWPSISPVAYDFFENGIWGEHYDYETGLYEWDFELDNFLEYAKMSPLGAYFICELMLGELADGSFDNGDFMWYELGLYGSDYSYYYTIQDYKDMIEEFESYREPLMAEIDEYYDEELAEHQLILDAIDEILSYEAVYTAAVEELNALAAQLPDLEIAWWEEQLAYNDLVDQINELYFVKYADAQALADRIAQYKKDIKDLEDENADWSEITELEHALTKLKGIYELDQLEFEVKTAICASLKAEFEAAYAELQAVLAEE